MDKYLNNKMFWLVLVLFLGLMFTYKGKGGLIDTIANRAAEKIQKEWSPSPYAPGVDPDKVDVMKLGPVKTN